MAKKLRDIAGKGQFSGVNKTTVAPPDIDDKNLYNWDGAKDGVAFVKKHDTETHEYPYDADAAFKGKKGGGSKTSKYKFQKDGVYEAACNHTNEGVMCELHGEDACPSGSDQEPRYKGKKVLLDKKVKEEVEVDEGIRPMTRKDTAYKDTPKRLSNQYPKSFKQPGTPSKSDLRSIATKASETAKVTKLPAGKAKGLKEDEINEVAPSSPKLEKWIKANKARFVKEYGKEKGTQVLYAKAWKMHGQSESGGATNTEYTSGTLGSTGRLDVGTL
jgi:hypothetical protein